MNRMKKLTATLISLVMALSLTACEKQVSVSSDPASASLSSTEASVSQETSVTAPEPEAEPAREYVETPIIVAEDEGYTVYVLKGDEQVGSYRVKIPDLGEVKFAHGDYIFYRRYEAEEVVDGEGNNYAYKVYNYKTGEDKLLVKGEWNGCIDIYQGKVILTLFNYFAGEYQEYCYDEKTMEPVESSNTILADIPEAYNNIVFLNTIDYFRGSCVERFMDETGYIRVRSDGKIYNFDGEAINEFDEVCDEDKDNYDLLYFNDECIIYETHNEDYSVKSIVDQSLITGRRTVISNDLAYLAAIEDGILYFLENEDCEYGLCKRTLCTYDVKEHTKERIVTRSSYPGTHGAAPFGDLVVSNGTIYAITNDGQTRDWSIYKDGDFKQLGIDTFKYNFGSDVNVGYVSETVKCEYCKAEIGCYYGEYAILGSSYGDKADAINNTLKESVKNQCEGLLGTELYFATDASDCANNGHGSYAGLVSYDLNLGRVFKINDNYLTVEGSAYWYGGGAHGYPFIQVFLFDLRTGEDVSFTDIYTGTEEDLKRVVAEATREHAKVFTEEMSPYYSYDDPDVVYEQAYNYISFETINVTYQKGGLIVEYPPYEMGPYASGFIEVFIPYSDLGITAFN